MYDIYRTSCLLEVYILHMYWNTGVICVSETCVMHVLYTCNTHKTPHMYYSCDTTGHVSSFNALYITSSEKWMQLSLGFCHNTSNAILKIDFKRASYVLALSTGAGLPFTVLLCSMINQ